MVNYQQLFFLLISSEQASSISLKKIVYLYTLNKEPLFEKWISEYFSCVQNLKSLYTVIIKKELNIISLFKTLKGLMARERVKSVIFLITERRKYLCQTRKKQPAHQLIAGGC